MTQTRKCIRKNESKRCDTRLLDVPKIGGAIIKKITRFRHKTQKFFFLRVCYQIFFGKALGRLADQLCPFSKIQHTPL
jgi:hypothetical protein